MFSGDKEMAHWKHMGNIKHQTTLFKCCEKYENDIGIASSIFFNYIINDLQKYTQDTNIKYKTRKSTWCGKN